MPTYDPNDDEDLWPDEGYAVIIWDEFKPPDSDDYLVMLGQFDNAEDVSLPVEATGYTIYVHGADGEGWKREDWQEEFGE